ncbi:UNVERIFIED_CONTAM: hypothetical protein GTU68_059325 [Idotea baltica]|nr:hypothetical protein [Idotea baltica]
MIGSPDELKSLDNEQLLKLADEIREALCGVVAERAAHFASNLGVVELAIALHLVFDFKQDRLIWDTGHQIYPHKLLTGRFAEFNSIRQKGGLMGYPNPKESDYDLFMTGHAGASVSTALGLKAGDDLLHADENRKSVAVIGDGALPSGVVFEAFNNAAGLDKNLLVILNDNKMGICPRTGGMAQYLDKARAAPFYNGLKRDVSWLLNKVPVVGESAAEKIGQFKDAVKGFLHGGMLFEEMGFRYVGPIDGHDLFAMKRYLEMVKEIKGPVLLHVFTEKGHGFSPAQQNPVKFHAPAPFSRESDGVIFMSKGSSPAYTNVMSDALYESMKKDKRVCVLTAAMCEGNKLGEIRKDFPDRFFDTGICEGHAVAFAGGMAKTGMRPVVDIYSTFLQRSFDHIFQEVSLQNLPVTFCMDRAGLAGPDGPTHHGVFDNSYMRVFPNITIMAPGDQNDVAPMLDFCLEHDGPTSIRYPKANADTIERELKPIELGKSEVLRWGEDGTFVCFGALLPTCVAAADRLAKDGLDIGVINARFLRPLDTEVIFKALEETNFVITVEENTLNGGFGSAVLEAANDAGINTSRLKRLGIPDRYIEHGERGELLTDLGLDVAGLMATAHAMAAKKQAELAS